MSDGLSLARLEAFLKVVEHGSIAHAAKKVGMQPSQLSRQVGELAEHFGKALVERRGRGIVVTAAGEQLAVVTRVFLRDLEALRAAGAEGPVPYTLGAGDSLLQWWVVPRISAVAKEVPRSVATLTSLASEDVVARLKDGRLDFGLVRADDLKPGLESRPLRSLEYALYAPRKLLAAAHTDDVAKLLCTLPLALQQSDEKLNDWLQDAAKKRGTLHVTLACETFPQAYRAMLTGRYAALLPTLADDTFSSKEFVELTVPGFKRHSAKVVLAWHKRTTERSTELARVATALEQCLAGEDE